MANILKIKKSTLFQQLGRRQKLKINDDARYFSLFQKSADRTERMLCLFNFMGTEATITTDVSGLNTMSFTNIKTGTKISFRKALQSELPAYGYRFYKFNNR